MAAFPDLQGKVGVVTGGASGIGRAIAQHMIDAGMRVAIADVESRALSQTAEELGARGFLTDVRSSERVQDLAEQVVDAFGTVHVICNNAGVGPMAPLATLTLDDWRWLIDVNLWGVIHGIQAFLPVIKGNPDGGFIVNTASMAGLMPVPELGAYCATKYAIVAITETLALELEREHSKIGAGVLLPGPVRTSIGRSLRNRPSDLQPGRLTDVELEDTEQFRGQPIPYVDSKFAGAVVIDGISKGTLYMLTHPEMVGLETARHDAILQAAATATHAHRQLP
jgi:NAD(P)-dependent dehydrogenase (short-subunit alcohol dehydrogenase family)